MSNKPHADFVPNMEGYSAVKPFRFWCQKVLPLVYDDSLSYYELLCKVVDYLNKTIEDVSAVEDNVQALFDAYQNLQNFVNTYFDNLDVQENVNRKLDEMAESGVLFEIFDPYFDEIKGEINGQLNAQNNRITELESRMSEFSRLPEGSTTGDAELADIRVGVNGNVYPNAGDAVRSQVRNLINQLDYNSKNLLLPFVNLYHNSGAIAWSHTENSVSASGTGSVSTQYIRLYYNETELPDGIEHGKTYKVKYSPKGSYETNGFRLEIYAYKTATDFLELFNSNKDGVFTYPESSEYIGLMVRIVVRRNEVVNATVFPAIMSVLTNEEIVEELKKNNSFDLLPYLGVDLIDGAGITFTYENGRGTAVGSTQNRGGYLRFFYDVNNLPNGFENGKSYYIDYDVNGVGKEDMIFEVYAYKTSSDFLSLFNSNEGGVFTIPADTSYKGLIIRIYVGPNKTVDCSFSCGIMTAMTNKALEKAVTSGGKLKKNVNVIKNGSMYYVRSVYDENNDAVYSFAYPETRYNHTFSLRELKLIPKNTELNDTVNAFNSAQLYKDCNDEIPAFQVDGVIVGSNHGNPNFIKCMCENNLEQNAVGSIWTDGTYYYTIVQVFSDYLIVGSVDDDGRLVVRQPEYLTRNGVILTVTNSSAYQLRRSAKNKNLIIKNNSGETIYNAGGGNNISVIETYDVINQSEMISYLQNNYGNLNNNSYYNEDIPYVLFSVEQRYLFSEKGSLTIIGKMIAKENLTLNRLYGGMSLNFHSGDNSLADYGFVPNSSNFAVPTLINHNANENILTSGNIVPFRFYQMVQNRGYFMFLINGLGDCNNGDRLLLNQPSWFSATADKLYAVINENRNMNENDVVSWGCGRGLFSWKQNPIEVGCFELKDCWILTADFSDTFEGYIPVPENCFGRCVEVVERSNVNVLDNYASNSGIKVNSSGRGYVILRLK